MPDESIVVVCTRVSDAVFANVPGKIRVVLAAVERKRKNLHSRHADRLYQVSYAVVDNAEVLCDNSVFMLERSEYLATGGFEPFAVARSGLAVIDRPEPIKPAEVIYSYVIVNAENVI